jgi:hypothetical protein
MQSAAQKRHFVQYIILLRLRQTCFLTFREILFIKPREKHNSDAAESPPRNPAHVKFLRRFAWIPEVKSGCVTLDATAKQDFA